MAGSIVVGLPDIFNRFDLETKDLILECPRIIRNKVAVKLIDWKVFGAFLGFPPEKLASIDVECRSEDERKIALLDCWHEREGEDATCLRLAEVLYATAGTSSATFVSSRKRIRGHQSANHRQRIQQSLSQDSSNDPLWIRCLTKRQV